MVTGFEPFGGATVNESWEAVRLVADAWGAAGGDHELVTARLPVTFAGAALAVRRLLVEHEPEVVVSVGLAAGTGTVRLERVAINVADARIADNDGRRPIDEPVVVGGPAAYLTSLPIKAALRAVEELGVPVGVSNSAGTYVCNATFYALAHAVVGRPVRVGFVHVPSGDVVPPATAARALSAVVRTAVRHQVAGTGDLLVAAGAEH
nr:pyroglutamyl-peptidase I [Isoptericola halotolerans]